MSHHRPRLIRMIAGAALATALAVTAACSSQSAIGPASTPSTEPSPGSSASPSGDPSGNPSGAGRSGGDLSVALSVEPDTLDPGASSQAAAVTVYKQIYDTLVVLNPATKEFEPSLATSWTTSEDGTKVTFTLRSDVTFQDGTPFDADAVKFSMERLLDPSYKSPIAKAKLGPLTGVAVVDDSTVEFDFSAPFPSLLNGLSQSNLGIVSPAAVQKYGDDFGKNPVGTGSMSFVEWSPGNSITLRKNPDYNWAPAILEHQGPAYLDTITFRIVTDNSARTAAIQSGDVDVAMNVAPADFALLKEAGGDLSAVAAPWSGSPVSLFLNTEKSPTADPAVRQAIEYGLDREQLLQTALFGVYSPAEGPLSPNTLAYDSSVEGLYPTDPAKAAALLDGAGWTMGSQGVRQKDGETLTLTVITNQQFQPIATTVQGLLKPLGFDVQVDVRDAAAATAAVSKGEANVGITGLVDSDPAGIQLFYSSANYDGFDWARIKDADIDKLLADQSTELDPAARAKLFGELQMTIMNRALIYPIYQGAFLYGIQSPVKGFATDVLAYPYYYNIWLDR